MGLLKGAMHVCMSIIASVVVGCLVGVIVMKDWVAYIVMGILAFILIFGHDYDDIS